MEMPRGERASSIMSFISDVWFGTVSRTERTLKRAKRRSRLNPVSEWIIKEVPDLRIVPDDLWHAVQERQKAAHRETRPDKSSVAFWNLRRPQYLLSGLMKCGSCGASYTKSGAKSLRMCSCPIKGHMLQSSLGRWAGTRSLCSRWLEASPYGAGSLRRVRERVYCGGQP